MAIQHHKNTPAWFSAFSQWGINTFLPFLPKKTRDFLQHIAWFLVIGGINTLIGYLLYVAFLNLAHLPVNWALAAAYIVGMTASYLNFKIWVFESENRQRFLRFVFGAGLVYVSNLFMLHEIIWLGLSEELAQLVLLPFLAAFSYIVNRYLVFGGRAQD